MSGCTSTLLAVSLLPMDLHTYSPALIGSGRRQKPFHHQYQGRDGSSTLCLRDRGCQFDSCLWNKTMQLLGSKCIHTTTYHPNSNSLIEQFHRQFKASLKVHTDPSHWTEKLPLVLLNIPSALKKDPHCTAAKVVYSTTLCLPGEFFNTTAHTDTPDQASHIAQLKVFMQQLRGSPV